MAMLQIGDSGPAVRKLQQALLAAGFNPGKADGDFGAGTEAAVMAFQHSAGLLHDGIAGPRTLRALGLARSDKLPSAVDRFSVQVVAQMFPQTPLAPIREHLPPVLHAMKAAGLADRVMLLAALATIRAETAGFLPIDEGPSRFNTSPRGHPFDLYDRRADLGNHGEPDGARYKGRGFVQLTGRHNYTVYAERLQQPLVEQPELANTPDVAAAVLAAFLKDRELQIKSSLMEGDLRAARRAVNGGSHGLEAFAEAYRVGDMLTDDEDL
ncbi:peptidoglycan-binding protein [Aquincola tertiaricarbonis]|uniref:Peptidoglycan-binding protein n=1 Tax=Aquincola tertiaricarbonis TaxID=391953 RepID=A0ABY4S5Q8_AQUTE|nr:peptidoglycan-binding protein [Aquincola tertiaricarbonis]URI08662.1 peptidoglycan-binding protein [Aquincola tertiaricarbonis]